MSENKCDCEKLDYFPSCVCDSELFEITYDNIYVTMGKCKKCGKEWRQENLPYRTKKQIMNRTLIHKYIDFVDL